MNKNNPPINLSAAPLSARNNKTGSWRTQKPVTDEAICIGCSLCAKLCPEGCITMVSHIDSTKLHPQTDYDYCKGCALCAHECPVKAIKMVQDY
jgi:2-oxoacid:acceptor oxidoreductase delta subunit (pyruvate/2-ketoisovalerate family)